ncbi:MAG: DUF4139 domain-containing protein, partial [Polyangiaceae bacterium]|nr:DUF4139 domain-containing protein [Polyangiaceae bacterium]
MRTARRVRAALGLLGALALGGCGGASYVHSDAALGRVVVYKNGVAYFERTAELEHGSLHLSVPSHLVDDLLKSFRILDADTGEPAPAGLPTIASDGADGRVDVELAFAGPLPRRVKLSYLTEAPTWKPSYRVAVRPGGKVDFEGWAIVDNTSGEDWRDVRLGVASSSALSFRYDLRSVRPVMRDTLLSSDRFAVAPPVGESTYGGAGDGSSV